MDYSHKKDILHKDIQELFYKSGNEQTTNKQWEKIITKYKPWT